uniref:Tektin n=1 Tax=Parascaris univalens TaxID=6257 RepID=A0A915C9C2_PARUN
MISHWTWWCISQVFGVWLRHTCSRTTHHGIRYLLLAEMKCTAIRRSCKEDATNSRCEDVERLLWNFIRDSSKDVHRCCSRIIAKKDLIYDLEKCVQEKVETMKAIAQLKMEAALRAKFQQQRYAFILSIVHGLETAYKKALASASAEMAKRISIRDDARTRIERLRDQLEDLTISAERLTQEWILDENHLQFTLNCLRQTRDALRRSTRRVTANDDREKKELDLLRRQRAALLIKTCKGSATILSVRQINKRKPEMKFNLDTRLIQHRNRLS